MDNCSSLLLSLVLWDCFGARRRSWPGRRGSVVDDALTRTHYTDGLNTPRGNADNLCDDDAHWLRRFAAALSLMPAVPAFAAAVFGTRLEQLLAIHPTPLFVVLRLEGMIEVPLNVQQMANEMPARIKKADADTLWFDVFVLVAAPRSATKADVVFEFKTRCALAPAAGYEQQRDSQNVMLSAMSTVVKLAQDRRLDSKWGAMCLAADESVAAA